MLRQIISVIVGVSVTVARVISLLKQEETPRERALYNNLWQTALSGAAQGLTMPDYPLSDALLPASLTVLHSFTRRAPREFFPEFVLADYPGLREVEPAFALEERAPLEGEISVIPATSFKAQLAEVGVDINDVPEKFFDNVVTFDIMENPVVAITSTQINGEEKRTEHVYDKSTYVRFGGICPENRLDFLEVKDHVTLRAEMETFIAEKKQEASLQGAVLR